MLQAICPKYEAYQSQGLSRDFPQKLDCCMAMPTVRSVAMCRNGTIPSATMTLSLMVRMPPVANFSLCALTAAIEHLKSGKSTQ